jgi:AGZA family xanthine/uracil permease-like MFS transporter
MTTRGGVAIWVPGDWNALFGLGTNVLVNLLVMTGLLKFVVQLPDEIIFGRILPAVGLMLFLGNFYYAFMAWRLTKQTGRADVCALPSGPSVPHMFLVVLVIMMPVLGMTQDPIKAWEAGLAWVFIQGFILILGGFIAPLIRRITPRAALLGTLAGVSIAFISMRPAMEMFASSLIGVTCLAIILVSWYGGVRYPRGIPAGLVAIGFGMVVAWGAAALGFGLGGMSVEGLTNSLASIGFSVPLPAFDHVFSGFEFLGFILVTAIPFGVYDLVEAMDNVESAEAAGDSYSTTEALAAEGTISLIGTLMGSPFANAVYIGHPGWKSMGGRIGYSAATGVMVLVFCWLGIASLLLNLIPVVAISPILLYIGALIGAQAFQTTPKSHAPAVCFALVPHLAAWAKVQIDGALGAAGTSAAEVGTAAMAQVGVLYEGMSILGNGAILSGLVIGAIVVFLIERKFEMAAAFAGAGAVLTFFGFMHGPEVGFAVTPMVAASYAIVAGFLFACAKDAEIEVAEPAGEALSATAAPAE